MEQTTRKLIVIMPSYLGLYDGSAKNRQPKFVRAVKSFTKLKYPNKHLIIVSDGCDRTKELYARFYQENKEITLVEILKQERFCGLVRQYGIEYANENFEATDIICYLDTDDELHPEHLINIEKSISDNEFVYFNDFLITSNEKADMRCVEIKYGLIGTSNIAHLNLPKFTWQGCNDYGHDYLFIQNSLKKTDKKAKIYGGGYKCRHIPNRVDN
jgi:glycosyltransferase involved in cell wall biosynthesis